MVDMHSSAVKVRRALLQRDLMGGVPTAGLVLLLLLSVVFIYVLQLYFITAFIAALYFVMRYLTSKDPWMIDIVLENIQQKDVFLP